MSRLISFGCSFTYGDWLPDCINRTSSGPGKHPSNFAWPTKLAELLEIECINNSAPGSSNKRIWNTVVNFNFKPEDLVFILWTYPLRTCSIHEDKIVNFGHWSDKGPGFYYYKHLYNEHNAILESKLYVNHTNLFLKEKNIKVYNLLIIRDLDSIKTLNQLSSNFLNLYFFEDYNMILPKALDNAHPGVIAHEKFARDIFTLL